MRIVVIGNGLAGTMAAKSLREIDAAVEIDVLAEEPRPYYPRPNLIEFLAGKLPLEKVFAFPENWEERLRIRVRAGEAAASIDPGRRTVETRLGESIPYDRLLLAVGSRAFRPPLPGADKAHVFTLRTLDDAQAILESLRTRSNVAVLGGGLLGLEIARALRERGAAVAVWEVMDRLLPRQLDPDGAAILKGRIETAGIAVRLGAAAEAILGGSSVSGLRLKGGEETAADMVIIAAGVRPDLSLALQAGIAVDKGVLVDDSLRTSLPDVFAAGDVVQHRGRVYGLIPAGFEQARAAASNMLGRDKLYAGTVPSTTLKVHGIAVTSVGLIQPDDPGYEILVRKSPEEGIYKKIVLKDGALEGAVWMGTKKGAAEITRLAASRTKIDQWKTEILEDGFDFSAVVP